MTTAYLTIEVPGDPQGKGRPRAGKSPTGKTVVYTPAKTRAYEKQIAWLAFLAMKGRPILEGPVWVHIVAMFHIPVRWSKADRERAARGATWHTSKPDADNVAKMLDGLNGIVWADDSQIADLRVVKRYSANPRMVISIGVLDEDADTVPKCATSDKSRDEL